LGGVSISDNFSAIRAWERRAAPVTRNTPQRFPGHDAKTGLGHECPGGLLPPGAFDGQPEILAKIEIVSAPR